MTKPDLKESALQASQLLKAIANPNRLMILCILVNGEKSVNELLTYLEISQPALSQHLLLMRTENLLDSRKSGTTVYYFINNEVVKKILTTLEQEYC